jgi:hypothetical protein
MKNETNAKYQEDAMLKQVQHDGRGQGEVTRRGS